MGSMWITSVSLATLSGVYAIERQPPALVQAIGTVTSGLIAQFPWGPDVSGRAETVTVAGSESKPYLSADFAAMADTFAPPGMSRSGSGWLSVIRKGFPDLRIGRILGATSPAAASASATRSGPVTVLTVYLKYAGAAGNDCHLTILAPSDGVSGHFNVQVTITSATGTTTDTIHNLDPIVASATYSWAGCPVDGSGDPILDASTISGDVPKLIGRMVLVDVGYAPTVPSAAPIDFTGGSDGGTIGSADYIGTAGTGNIGLATFENEPMIRSVFADDVGTSVPRLAVSTALVAHAALMGERIAFVSGDPALTLAAMQTQKAALSGSTSFRAVWCDPWVYQYDENQNIVRVPPQSFWASVMAQLPVSTAIAWKGDEVINMLQGVVRLESARGAGAYTNTLQGISTMIAEENGGFSLESDVLMGAPTNPAKKHLTRTRTGDYVAYSLRASLRGYVNIPNVTLYGDEIRQATQQFIDAMVDAQNKDPVHTPHMIAATLLPEAAWNNAASRAAGDYIVAADLQFSGQMEHIIFSLRFGETVTVSVQA